MPRRKPVHYDLTYAPETGQLSVFDLWCKGRIINLTGTVEHSDSKNDI